MPGSPLRPCSGRVPRCLGRPRPTVRGVSAGTGTRLAREGGEARVGLRPEAGTGRQQRRRPARGRPTPGSRCPQSRRSRPVPGAPRCPPFREERPGARQVRRRRSSQVGAPRGPPPSRPSRPSRSPRGAPTPARGGRGLRAPTGRGAGGPSSLRRESGRNAASAGRTSGPGEPATRPWGGARPARGDGEGWQLPPAPGAPGALRQTRPLWRSRPSVPRNTGGRRVTVLS